MGLAKGLGEGFEVGALLGGELGGDGDLDVDVEVTMAVFAEDFDAFAAQAEGGAVLGASGDFEVGFAFEGGDGDLAAEGGGGEGEGHLAVEVIPFALEDVVGADVDDDVEISRGAAFAAVVAIAAGAEAGAVFDAGGDFDADFGALFGFAGAGAGPAGVADDFATAAAVGAGLLDLEEAAGGDDLADAAAGGAGFAPGAAGGAAAMAAFAGVEALVFDLAFAAVGGFFEGDLHGVAEVVAALGTVSTLASAASAASAEEAFEDASATTSAAGEDFAEDVERIVEAAAGCAAGAAHAAGKGLVAVAVVGGAFLVVVEDVVSFADFFEFVFGAFVAGVFVGVIFDGELAVGLFEVVGGGVAGDAEHFVIVAFFCHGRGCAGVRLLGPWGLARAWLGLRRQRRWRRAGGGL